MTKESFKKSIKLSWGLLLFELLWAGLPAMIFLPIGNMSELPLYEYKWHVWVAVWILVLWLNLVSQRINDTQDGVVDLYNEIEDLKNEIKSLKETIEK